MSDRLGARRRFLRPNGTVCLIGAEPLASMVALRQSNPCDPEAGGVLLGRHLLGVPHIVVDEVTTPTKGDAQSRTAFHRSQRPHQQVIDARWATSGGTCQYLGEWHTHPEAVPRASSVDMADWRRRLREDVFDAATLLFVIVGTQTLRVWEGQRREGAIALLHEISEPIR